MSADQKVAGGVLVMHGRPPEQEAEKYCFPETRGRCQGDRTPNHGRPPSSWKTEHGLQKVAGDLKGTVRPVTVDRLAMKNFFHAFFYLSCFHMRFYMLIYLFVYMSTCFAICSCFLPSLNCFWCCQRGRKITTSGMCGISVQVVWYSGMVLVCMFGLVYMLWHYLLTCGIVMLSNMWYRALFVLMSYALMLPWMILILSVYHISWSCSLCSPMCALCV